MKLFEQYQFQPFVKEILQKLNFQSPTEIQKSVIPLVYKHRDVIGISQTGTGKTHAFLIPIMDMIETSADCVQAVITAPTRELAQQIYDQAKVFTNYNKNLRVSLIIGGKDKQKTISKLNVQPHLVIGTPGRIKDLSLEEQALKITTADIFVIDEADMTLEYGYLEDIDAVLGKMKENLQMLVFSATIPQMLRPFLKEIYGLHQRSLKLMSICLHHVIFPIIWLPTKHRERYDVFKASYCR